MVEHEGGRGIDVGQGAHRAADRLGEPGRPHSLAADVGDEQGDGVFVEREDIEEVAADTLGFGGGAVRRADAQVGQLR